MKRKIIAFAAAAVLLTGCTAGKSAESTETSAEVAAAVTESTTEVLEVAATTVSAASETTTAAETEEIESPTVVPADEVYDVYPKRIIYTEKRSTDITAENVSINEGFEKSGKTVVAFSAEYPVFSGGDEAVIKKINDGIKAYIDGIYNEEKESAAKYTLPEVKEDDEYDFPYDMCGFYWERAVTAGGFYEYSDDCYDINGNILSVYFIDFSYGAGAAHGYETPVPLAFDLRTGERIDFDAFIADKSGLSEVMSKALYDYLYAYNYTPSSFHNTDADKYAEYNEKRISELKSQNLKFGFDEVRNGCVCFYLAPYEYGCYADGIRRIDLPVSDILPCLNEAGTALFDGCVSAESEPVNVIEYRGKRYFDNIFSNFTLEVDINKKGTTYPDGSVEIIDYSYYWRRGEFPPKMLELTDTDYEFLGLFPDIVRIELHGCGNIDFEKLAKIKNIENITSLELEYCEFGDIAPLLETNIYTISGDGVIVPFEQAEVFQSKEGNYIVNSIIGPEYVEYKGHTFALTGNGVLISDRELDETDYEFIAAREDIGHLEFERCTLDYERLSELGNFKFLVLTECTDIDFAAVAKIDFIYSLDLNNCVFDDISPLYGSKVTRIYGEGERDSGQRISNIQMQEFLNNGGEYIDGSLVE